MNYSLMRVALFGLALVLLWWAGMGSWLLVVVAAGMAWALSYVLLAGPRERAARYLEARSARRAHHPGRFERDIAEDAAVEDAALESSGGERARVEDAAVEGAAVEDAAVDDAAVEGARVQDAAGEGTASEGAAAEEAGADGPAVEGDEQALAAGGQPAESAGTGSAGGGADHRWGAPSDQRGRWPRSVAGPGQ